MTINVRIKQFPPGSPGGVPRPATTKIFLRPGREMSAGCRPLEPGEIITLEDDEATELLAKLPYELEMTVEPATRPLYFRNMDEANMTSQYFNPNSAGRAEEAKLAMKRMWEDAEKPENVAEMEKINALAAREAAVHARELELGLVEPTADEAFSDEVDDELDAEGYVPENNALSHAELKDTRDAAAAERDAPAEAPPAPRQRRRRRATAA